MIFFRWVEATNTFTIWSTVKFFASFETFFLAMEPENFIHHCASCGKAEAIDSIETPTETSASWFSVERWDL